jgi:tungstate transport system substrate-binding protein
MRAFKPSRIPFIPIVAVVLSWFAAGPLAASDRFITVASTTSTENSGLFAHILPQFQRETGIAVRVVAVGTGQAMTIAERGDADVLFVHHRPSEDKFVADGFGVGRRDVMYNDFLIVGPAADPARIQNVADVTAALAKIAAANAIFISRGDDSGTHKLERTLWSTAGVDVSAASGSWYREAGASMGGTLNIASAVDGYTLSDRGTWLSFRNRGSLTVLLEGDQRLRNPYGVILVNPARHPHVKAADGQAFIEWLTSPRGQAAIADFKIDGETLFFPDAQAGGS